MKVKFLTVLAAALALSACATAPQLPVSLNSEVLTNDGNQIGVAIAGRFEPNVYLPGADCLLCIATAEAMNSSLSKHVDNLQTDEFTLVRSDLVRELKDHGVSVIAIEEPIDLTKLPKSKLKGVNVAKRDFSAYADKNITHLLVVDIEMLGMHRSYASYVPTSDPKAVFKGSAFLVNVSNNEYQWYKRIEYYRSAEGEWDESPEFPALTNAYFQVLAEARDEVTSEF